LPIARSADRASHAEDATKAKAADDRLLVADDSNCPPDAAEAAGIEGYEVVTATDGKERSTGSARPLRIHRT
jgi:hypothetical protein